MDSITKRLLLALLFAHGLLDRQTLSEALVGLMATEDKGILDEHVMLGVMLLIEKALDGVLVNGMVISTPGADGTNKLYHLTDRGRAMAAMLLVK